MSIVKSHLNPVGMCLGIYPTQLSTTQAESPLSTLPFLAVLCPVAAAYPHCREIFWQWGKALLLEPFPTAFRPFTDMCSHTLQRGFSPLFTGHVTTHILYIGDTGVQYRRSLRWSRVQ